MKPKKIISIALTLVMLAVMLPMFSIVVFAESSDTYGDNLTWLLNDSGTLTISGTGNMADYEYAGNVPWYSCCSSIKSVVIEKGVTSIGNMAFLECRELKSVTIPDSVTSIGNGAFSDCSSLTSIEIPNTVTSIGNGAFSDCRELKSVTIPDSVTSIGGNAFATCEKLENITIGNSVTSIGDSAFDYTEYYKNASNWENGVLYIGNYLIKANSGSILGDISIKSETKLIADGAFYDCSSLESVTIPNTVTNIGDRAFCGCSSLTSIEIPDSVTSIGGGAFDSTGYYNNASNWKDDFLYIENYLIKADDKISGNINIKDGTKLICGKAFDDCDDLTGVTIPNTVTSIGSRAFDYCRSLKSITIPDSVTSIGDEAFYSCKELTSIKLPKGITTISNRMFKNCKSLTSLDIPNGVTSIGYEAFSGCDSLNCINYDGTKKEWKAITIDSTNELTNVEINYLREPETTTTVSENIFTVTGKNIDGCTVILALYKEDSDGNSQLVECQTVKYSGNSIPFTTTATDYTSAKVMVWKDLETLEPVCEAYEMNFQ